MNFQDPPMIPTFDHIIEQLFKHGFNIRDSILDKSYDLLGAREATIPIEFAEVKKVNLEGMPNLRSFSSGNFVEWGSLERVVVNNCPNIKKFGFGKIKISQLKSVLINEVHCDINTQLPYLFESSEEELSVTIEYNVDNDEELYKRIQNLQPFHFTNLHVFRAKNCNQILTAFFTMLVIRSPKLEVINIEQSNIHPSLVSTYFDLSDLREIKLTKINMMETIWDFNTPEYPNLQNLQIFHIKDCQSLKYIFHYYQPKMLHQLKELVIEACEELTSVFHKLWEFKGGAEIPLLSKVELKSLPKLSYFYEGDIGFPSLKYLIIEKCPILKFKKRDPHGMLTTYGKSLLELNEIVFHNNDNLICVISSKTLQELRNLKILFVSHCKELKILFNIYVEISSSTHLLQQLHKLALTHLPKLTQIVNKKILRFHPNLKILQVKQCNSLNGLLVPLTLTNMEISDCEMLEKIRIIEEEEEEGTREKFTFRELKDVSLENLVKLSIVFPSKSEFPSLETLKIANCSALKTFVEDVKAFPESSTLEYFFTNSLSLGKLKELHMINQDFERLWHYSCPSESFCELEILSLTSNNKLLSVISSSMIIRFKKLSKLTLDKCELLTEVFSLEDDKENHKIQEILPQLQVLSLINLSKFKCIWNKEPQVSFFPNLVSLYIIHCGSLQSLFSFTSTKNLGKLKSLTLCNCDIMEEVICSDIYEDKNVPIIFPKLEYLVMKDLPNLISFYRESRRTFNWPNLKMVRVSKISRMERFSESNLNTPLLGSVYITFVKKLWLGNLNDTISYMHNNSENQRVRDSNKKKGKENDK